MNAMDVKGISWVGNMCQRFEAMCVDVDEKIYEDTFVYAGDQMRTVGESVKKFYTKVMQDLLASSSLDSAKEKHVPVTRGGDVDTEICKIQKLIDESESVDTASDNMGKLPAEDQSTPENSKSQFVDSASNKSSVINHQFKSFSDLSRKGSVEEFTCNESWNIRDCESGNINPIQASVMNVCTNDENEVQTSGDVMEGYVCDIVAKGSHIEGITLGHVSTVLDDSVSSMKAVVDTTIKDTVEADNEFSVLDAETSYSWLCHEIKIAGADKEQCLKLGESCVLVENDDHFSNSALENGRKSYKKKIREAFSPRRWSKSKRNEDRYTGRYEEQSGKSLVSTSTIHSDIQKSPTSESLDSEWELL